MSGGESWRRRSIYELAHRGDMTTFILECRNISRPAGLSFVIMNYEI